MKRLWLFAIIATASAALPPSAGADTGPVTFSKDVAPILQEKCQSCHQPNSIAPMSLITYQEARPWARSIKDRVATRQMPPWHIDRSIGIQKFKNDMSLSDAQVDTIVRWVDQGAVEGNRADLPAPKPLNTDNEWQAVRDGYGEPDMVIRSAEYKMPAVHQDVWWRPMSEIPLKEPRWVKLVEIRPTNLKGRKIVHHSIAYHVLNEENAQAVSRGTASGRRRIADDDPNAPLRTPELMEWAIGKGYDLYRPGTGKLVMPGERISWDQHLHAVGEDITAGSEIGLWFYPKGQEPAKRSYLIGFSAIDPARGLDIAPNTVSVTDGFTVLTENALIESFQPHFHLRGKAMRVEAIKPDGTRETLSYVDKFNFNWMTAYIYADDAAPVYPKGTTIHVTAWHDNTKANKNNPDPDQWVGSGDRTVDEMAFAWMNVEYLSDDEYAVLEKERSKSQLTEQQQQQQ